jgi:hypothetical protein
VPITDDRGWYTHWVGVRRDYTGRKQLAAQTQLNAELARVTVRTAPQLEAAELEAFSYSVSRACAPLNTVNGWWLLVSNADSLSDRRHYLGIRAGTQQMGELIEGRRCPWPE